MTRHAADTVGPELVRQLRGCRAVAEFPRAVEGLFAERRIPTADEVEVTVPDTA